MHHQPAAVVRQQRDRDLVARVALAEELPVGCRVRAQRVVHHARRDVAVALVVEPPAVRRQRHLAVARGGKHIGQVLARIHVAQPDGDLVHAAFAHGVRHQPAVVRDVAQRHAGRVVGAERMGIDQHAVGAVQPVADVDDRQLLVGAPPAVEVAPAALVRQPGDVPLQHPGGDLAQPLAPRQRPEHRIRVGVLRVDPPARRGRLLVFEPAVRVGHRHAVQRIDDVPGLGGGRGRHATLRLLGGARRQQRRTGERRHSSRSGHGVSGHHRRRCPPVSTSGRCPAAPARTARGVMPPSLTARRTASGRCRSAPRRRSRAPSGSRAIRPCSRPRRDDRGCGGRTRCRPSHRPCRAP